LSKLKSRRLGWVWDPFGRGSEDGLWHRTDLPTYPHYGRYWGKRTLLGHSGIDAIDPLRKTSGPK